MSCLVTATTLLLSIPTSISPCLPYNQSLTTTFFTPFLSHDFSPLQNIKAMGSLHVKAIFLLQAIAITPSTA
jgi:hypothetical protein